MAPGLVKQGISTRSDRYRGTAQAIVASGLATPDMLPGQPGRGLTSVCYRPAGVVQDGRPWWRVPGYLRICRLADQTVVADIVISEEEQCAREQAERAAVARAGADREESEEVRALRQSPQTKQAFRAHLEGRWRLWSRCLRNDVADATQGYKVSDEDVEELDELIAEIDALLCAATIVGPGPAKLLQSKLARRAANDTALQAFLHRVQS
jgi:hypothetical protein